MAFSSSSLVVVFHVYLLFVLLTVVSANEKPIVKLFVSPTSGDSAANVEVRCEISPPPTISSLSSSKFDNVYLSVKTDGVKPSGILLMFHDSTDRCQLNRENVQIDVCNATLIRIHVNQTIVNETLQNIVYSCSKGATYAYGSYKLTQDRSARFYDPLNSSTCLCPSSTLFLFASILLMIKVQWF